ncbi:MAG: acetoin dehydrogenase dihydrolipoyllysine-residue acetyltransferase subunit [Nevskia sp.]|nr:acetoin dehydrogenase dihydrolipoyllysine-residue acetyltransferase subunit [Nevskia sp.]
MIVPITMPRWGLTMTEGTVVEWHVQPGASVGAGQMLLDIETTKITNTLEAAEAGVLRRHVAEVGQTLPCGALIAVMAPPETPDAEIDAYVGSFVITEVADAGGAAEVEPKTAAVGDLTLNYLRAGAGAAVVFIHGFGGDLSGWALVQTPLASAFDTIALDLPGHGKSSKRVPHADVAGLAGELAAFLDAIGVQRAHLVGHSLGGAVALAFALAHPQRAASLSLLAPAGLGREINAGYIRNFIRAERRKDVEANLRQLFCNPDLVNRALAEDVIRYKRLDGVRQSLEALEGAFLSGEQQATVLRERLAEVQAPVLVIWGREDRIVPPAQGQGLPANVQVEWLERSGHMPQVEAADKVVALLKRHFAKAA